MRRMTTVSAHERPQPLPSGPVSTVIYYLVRAASALLAIIPVQVSYALAGVLGELYCRVNPGHSRWAAYNYARVLHEPEESAVVQRMARKSFANYARVLVDFFRLPHLTREAVQSSANILGTEHLTRAMAGGKGCILVSAHMGSWDRAAVVLAGLGYPTTALVDTFPSAKLDAWVTRTRARHGMKGISTTSPGALREMYRTLTRGEALGFLLDHPEPNGVQVTFFGETAGLPAGVAQVALRTGAPVLVAGMFRAPGNRTYTGFVEPVPIPPSTGDRATDAQRLTQLIVTRLERAIVAHPDQWFMFRPMWPVQE